jgi:DNA repair exonuclease SbcCD ATPase subunit
MPERDFGSLIEDCKKSIVTLESEIVNLRNEKDDYEKKSKILAEKLSAFGDDIATQDQLDEMETKSASLAESIKSCEDSVLAFKKELEVAEEKISKIHEIRQNFPIESIKGKLQEAKVLDSKSIEIKHGMEKQRIILKEQEQSVKRLEEVPCGESFPTCKFIKDSISNKKLIEGQRKKIEDLRSELNFVLAQLNKSQVDVLEERLKKYEDMLSKQAQLGSNRETLVAKIDLFESRIKSLREEKVGVDASVSDLQVRIASTGSHGKASEYKKVMNKISEGIRTCDSSVNEKLVKIGVLQERISSLEKEKVTFVDLKTRWAVQDRLLRAYNKDGIPMMILASELPVINDEISKILQGIAGFTVKLETDETGSDLEVMLDYGDSRRPIELGSGMEKMMSSLAIRVALINVSSLPKSDILIIDEGFGALDEQNVEACNRLLHSLKRFFKTILIISHVDAIKDAVDSSIEITQTGTDAHVSAC